MTAFRDTLSDRILAVRTRLGLAQRAFATRIGVTRNIVIRWERGHHRPSSGALERIAAAGGVTVDWLLKGEDGQTKTPHAAGRVHPFDLEAYIREQERREPWFRREVELEMAAMDLEQQLIRLREARGLSQAQLGRRLGVTRFVVNEMELGERPLEIPALLRWVAALGGRLAVTRAANARRRPPSRRR